ncbi:hypothetical protein SAMN06265795_1054 [Noviherbaspirillum humi]|uniref:Uncharacterized protein n=1 Tax=Noviherbaspirillum humi TaxID=1688639 RepID=A0A239GG95_9BURK|nr:hypothetical protein [Noviherbaspirillum humi]SNS67925.1 hypothetical protein SAMN06265795_1054 [Noviherbaspirillum humi]
MADIITHRGTRIISLDEGELQEKPWRDGDIVIVQRKDGWWTEFAGADGELEGYDAPFPSHKEALWTAKAAAEFAGE